MGPAALAASYFKTNSSHYPLFSFELLEGLKKINPALLVLGWATGLQSRGSCWHRGPPRSSLINSRAYLGCSSQMALTAPRLWLPQLEWGGIPNETLFL